MFGKNKIRSERLSQIFLQPKTTTPQPAPRPSAHTKMSKAFLAFLAIICTTTVTAFFIVKSKGEGDNITTVTAGKKDTDAKQENNTALLKGDKKDKVVKTPTGENPQQKIETTETPVATTAPLTEKAPTGTPVINDPVYTPISRKIDNEPVVQVKYRIRSSAPVYKRPNAAHGKIVAVKWQKSFYPFNALAEENGFIYAIVANNKGYEVEGWLRKKDLVAVNTVYHASDLK